jgi:hypothetical protein
MDTVPNKGLEKEFETTILFGTKITTHNQNHALNKDLDYEKFCRCQISTLSDASNHVYECKFMSSKLHQSHKRI